jgi:hypothetical protein
VIRRFGSRVGTDTVRGAAWTLSVLWAGIGAAAGGYVFLVSTRTVLDPASPFAGLFDWPGGRWNDAATAAAALAAALWLVLAIPVLIAGLRRLLGWPGKRLMAAAWAGAWAAELALMALIPASVSSPPQNYSGGPITNWQELVIGTGFLALAAVMARILARPAGPQRYTPQRPYTTAKHGNAR